MRRLTLKHAILLSAALTAAFAALGVGLYQRLYSSEDLTAHLLSELPEVKTGPQHAPEPHPESLADLVHSADAIVVARVESELPAQPVGELRTDAGLQGAVHRVFVVTPQHEVKGKLPPDNEILKPAESFNGEFRATEWNPPLEVGKEYLLFLRVLPESGKLWVTYPFIYMVVDGRLYWAGARFTLEQDGNIDPMRGWAPLLDLWDVPVEEAVDTLRAAIGPSALQ
jgi:hypothetical protein